MSADAPAPRTVVAAGLSGRTLRYAEAVASDGGPRLRRLGAADFPDDVAAAVFGSGDPDAIAAVADALADGLGGTAADVLVIAAHPTVTTSFFTPLPAALAPDDRDVQIRQEAALLADLAPTQAVRVRAHRLRTEPGADGADRTWYHVVHVAEPVHARLSLLADALGVDGYDLADSTRAVAAVAPAEGVSLTVGTYAGHTEVAVSRDGAFLFGTHGPSTAPADTAYFALAALQQARATADEVARVAVYGDDATAERLALLAEFVGRDTEPLDPFSRFGRRPEADPAELAAFGPVLGAAL